MDPITQIYLENVDYREFDKEAWLKKYNYTFNADKTLDIHSDNEVALSNRDFISLPFNFNKVEGPFSCSYNNLKTLKGCPKYVGGDFYCYTNRITSLEGGPEIVMGSYHCFNCDLTTLKGIAKHIGGHLYCYANNLESLDFLPDYLGGTLSSDFPPEYNQIALQKIKDKKYIRTLSHDDEMPDVTDIFD